MWNLIFSPVKIATQSKNTTEIAETDSTGISLENNNNKYIINNKEMWIDVKGCKILGKQGIVREEPTKEQRMRKANKQQ